MITFQCVPTADVEAVWTSVEAWIAKALSYGPGLYAPEDVLAELKTEEQRLWVVREDDAVIGCATTSVQQFPRRKVLIVGPVGGQGAHRWVRGLDGHLGRYAASMGCDGQISEGRKGWDRLVGNGWTVTATQYFRELSR